MEGELQCEDCGKTMMITRGILRAVSDDDYVGNFSFEWQLHRKTQLDNPHRRDSELAFVERTGLTASDLEGKDVLDVGVGTGRYADIAARAARRLVGIDLSFAVETAMENVGNRDGINIVQADCQKLPFETESFDVIYSIGVLHHTPDTKRSFLSLLPYLRPGGTIAIWVYDGHVWGRGSSLEIANRFWRAMTTRLPNRLLYALCLMELPYYYLRKIPGFNKALHMLLPGILFHAIPQTNDHSRVSEHVLDTFDWYSPKYQFKHTYPEVFGWFEEAGLTDIRVNTTPVAISGRKLGKRVASPDIACAAIERKPAL
jgi:SAM-dependent methyltransferase